MIAIIGDIIIDEYIFGDSTRLSPEAPVPIVKHIKTEHRGGGSANVFNNVQSLTNDVLLCTHSDNPPKKVRIFSRGHYISRLDYEGHHIWELSPEYKSADIVIISDYNKGSITNIKDIPDLPKYTIVDPKKMLNHYSGAWCIKPNSAEFEQYAGKWESLDELYNLMALSISSLNITHLIVTLGPDGVAYMNNTGECEHIHSAASEVFDVTGAGDTFIAVLAYALDNNYQMIDAIKLANKAAGIAVSHLGTYVIKPSDIL